MIYFIYNILKDEAAVEVFHSLKLTDDEVNVFYSIFWDIDSDSSGMRFYLNAGA
jgi:hypothetical protein